MDFTVFLEKIGIWNEGKKAFWEIHKRLSLPGFENTLKEAYKAYNEGDKVFEDFLETLVNPLGFPVEVLTLYFYIRISERTYEEYKRLGIPDEIFYPSMDDFATASHYGLDRIGIYGIPRSPDRPWHRLILENRIYRLGRLQFELMESPVDAECDGVKIKTGEPCINVHIPGYAPLCDEECEKSYSLARKFFKKYYGIENCFFFCHSWLLAPWLSEALSEKSGIVRFGSKYKIYETEEDTVDTILYVFAKKCDNPKDYPEDTTLKKLIKERLLKELPLQASKGFRI